MQEQLDGAEERASRVARQLEAKDAELVEARREAVQQGAVLGKQQEQLHKALSETGREREAAKLAAAELEELRSELRSAEAKRLTDEGYSRRDVAELRSTLDEVRPLHEPSMSLP